VIGVRGKAMLAAGLVAAAMVGCGGGEQPASRQPLPRVQIRGGQGTDIGSLPTVAPPPALRSDKRPEGGGAPTPTATPVVVPPTPTPSPVRTPAPPIHTPVPTPTFAPPDG
jgi:hypothetical protein